MWPVSRSTSTGAPCRSAQFCRCPWLPLLVSAGVLAGVLLALGGLIHELGHVYAARRVGLAAESIRLGFAFRATVFPGDVCLPCCRWSSRASPRSTSCSPSSFAWWPLLARQCRWENWRTRRAAGLGCRGNWYGHDAARSLAARHACAAASDVASRDRDPAAARSGDGSRLAGASVSCCYVLAAGRTGDGPADGQAPDSDYPLVLYL